MAIAISAVTCIPSTARAQTQTPYAGPAVHATRGVVKSINPATLVVSRPRNRGDITFTLSSSTHREGTIVVGATVSVRYRDEGKVHLATAVALQKSGG
jgi:hypothetical protein